jgi:hypothetical protein
MIHGGGAARAIAMRGGEEVVRQSMTSLKKSAICQWVKPLLPALEIYRLSL